MIFRHVEHNGNRLELSDHHESVRTPRENGIACVDQPQTNPPGSVICDVTVAKLDHCILHLTKVEFDGSLVLNHDLFLVVENLLCDSVRSEGLLVASKIDLRLAQNSAVVIQETFCLLQLCLVGTRINIDQRVAFLYHLPLGIVHCKDLTAHLAEHVYRRNWRYCAEGIDVHAHIASIGCAGANDDGMARFKGGFGISLVPELLGSRRKGDAEHHDG